MRFFTFALLALIFVGCAQDKVDDDKTLQRMSRLLAAIDPPSAAPPSAPTGGDSAAPVGNLLEGLEQRLASEPNDAAGWALLAQSYAFVGRNEDATNAVEKAVALGMDETELTQRVDKARKPHPTNSP